MHKFEKLEVWQLAIAYTDHCYALAQKQPRNEEYSLGSQLRRAAVSVALNIAEGSTSLSDAEQARFLEIAVRSLIETVACRHLIHRRKSLSNNETLREAYQSSEKFVAKLQAMRWALLGKRKLHEESADYTTDSETPFDE